MMHWHYPMEKQIEKQTPRVITKLIVKLMVIWKHPLMGRLMKMGSVRPRPNCWVTDWQMGRDWQIQKHWD